MFLHGKVQVHVNVQQAADEGAAPSTTPKIRAVDGGESSGKRRLAHQHGTNAAS